MFENILFRGALIVDPAANVEKRADLRVQDGVITEISDRDQLKPLPNQLELQIDCQGLVLCPGLIDMHTHMRDLGQKDKEDLNSGTKAAAAGGFTTVVSMANTDPVLDSGHVFSLFLNRIKEQAIIEVLPVGALTKGLKGQEMSAIYELSALGAVAFSDDGMPVENMALLKNALNYTKLTGKVVISHAEDKNLSAGGIIHDSPQSIRLGLSGYPGSSEAVAIAREVEVVQETNAPYHFTHISTARGLELIRRAKADGLPVSADITPHHLALSVEDITKYDTHFKMNPPLAKKADKTAIAQAIIDGTVDAIATDHAPHSCQDKCSTMKDSPFGIIGLETAFAVCYEILVEAKLISLAKLIAMFTTAPAQILGLPLPSLEIGSKANLILLDPDYKWIYDPQTGHSKSKNSPFSGRSLKSKVLLTICKGNVVYDFKSLCKTKPKAEIR